MASFLLDLAKPYVEKLINGVIAESSYICCFACIAKDFEEEKAGLVIERATFERRILEAKRRGEDVQRDAVAWKDEVDELIQEDTKEKQKCFFEFCPHCLWRYSRGKLLANKKERIKILMETGKILTIGCTAPLPDIERRTSQHYVHLKSREFQYAELLVELKDDNNYIIGLHGMGGTGKTTLIKEVGKELKKSKQFSQVIDTTVSFSPNIKKIQDDIAGPLGLKFDDCNDTDRPGKLWNRLTNGEKILLILDDVWGHVDFDEIGIPCSDNHKGCRIIVTTRNWSVCNKLRCNKTVQLDLLSKEDAWIMFKKYADLSETSTKFFLDKGRKISNECKNLPIAIAVIASSLKGKQHHQHQDEWDMALKFLKKDISRHNDDDGFLEIYECFKFSYDKLSEEAKSLFLLCSVFREDEDIHIESLARLAIGGGLFGEDNGSYEEARSRVVISKNKLLDSFLLLEADQRRVKMHDFARDAAQWIADNKIQTRKGYDKNQKAMIETEKNIKYLLCEGKPEEVFSCKFDGSKLEILIVIIDMARAFRDKEIEVLDSFFENNTNLRVFHLRCVGFWSNISLPQSIQQLKNIRSLIFEHCDLGDISIFGNLQSLEELDLDHCRINEMPNGITVLEKFRLLRLEKSYIGGNNPFEVIKRCSSLQELYFVDCLRFLHGEISFPKLQRFHVSDGGVHSSLSKYVSIEWTNELFLSETTLKYCMQEAEFLRLRRIEGEWRNIILDIIHMDLVELDLSFISQLKFLIHTNHTHSQVSNVFSKLVVLHLSNLKNLEELCNGSLSVDSFKSLESLSIKYCQHLRSLSGIANQCNLKSMSVERCPVLISLFEVFSSDSLALLEILEVIHCENLEYLIKDERKGKGSKREIVDSNCRDPIFSKLKVLKIIECPKLEILLPLISAHDLPALKSIKVENCDKLNYIFGQDIELGCLENMELDFVPNLIDIFAECNRTTSFSINRSSPISISSSKPTTHSDPIKCSTLSWTGVYCCGKKYEKNLRSTTSTKIPLIYENQAQTNLMELHSNCLLRQSKIMCNVKNITLTNLNKIKSVFVLSITPKMLLETLTIENCDELKHIIIDTRDHDSTGGNNFVDVFPKLKRLVIDDCAELEYIFGHYTNDQRNHTENHLHLSSLDYVYLCELPSLVAICPKQYHTTFPVLNVLVLKNCSRAANIKSIDDFIPRHVNCTAMKGLSGSMEDLLALEDVKLINSKIESIFCVNEVNEQQVNLGLRNIELKNLNVMVCPFVGSKNSVALMNLTKMTIKGCEKLQIIFSASILRCLPQLEELVINKCEELKQIFKDDLENQNMSNSSSCFPKLNLLAVQKCNKLKYVFPVSICNEFPELKALIITKSKELEEIFKRSEREGVEKFMIPNLDYVAFCNLPSLFQTQEIQFKRAEHRFIKDCDKFSLTSTSTWHEFSLLLGIREGLPDMYTILGELAETETEVKESSKDDLTSPQQIKIKQTQETDQGFVENVVGLVTPSVAILPTNSQAPRNEQSVDQQSPLEEIDASATVTLSQLEGSVSEKAVGTKNESPIQLVPLIQKCTEISVEEETTSANAKKITLPTRLELELINEQTMTQQQSLGESHTIIKPSQGNNDIVISVEQGATSTNSKAITSSNPTVTSEHNSSSQALMNEQSVDQQSSHEETDAAVTPSVLEGSISGKAVETKESAKQKDIKISVEGGTASTNTKTLASSTFKREKPSRGIEISVELGITSTNSKAIAPSSPLAAFEHNSSSLEYCNGQTTLQSFSISTKDPLAMEVVDLGGSPETNPIKSLGDTSQIGSSLLVRRELEQLVSEKHLNYETLSLLTDFLVKHPSVLLKDTLLTNRYKGYAYNCLAELLKFLQTHSVLDVLGSSHSEFVGLIQDVRKFSFNKDWLDGVEKRALFPDLQFSRDAMQKLLDSKKQVTKEVEEMRLKLYFFNQHVEDIKHQLTSSEAVLASIIQQEEHVLETTAALSVPLGY